MPKVVNILSTGDKIDNKGDEQLKPACYLNNSISLVINFLEPSKCRSDVLAAAPAKKVLPAPSCYLKLDFPLVFSALGVKGCIFYLQLTIIYNPCLENTEGTDVLVERSGPTQRDKKMENVRFSGEFSIILVCILKIH